MYLPLVGKGVRVCVCLGRDVGVDWRMFRDWVDVEGPPHRAQASTPGVLHTSAIVNSNRGSKGEGIPVGHDGGSRVWSVLVTDAVLTAHAG